MIRTLRFAHRQVGCREQAQQRLGASHCRPYFFATLFLCSYHLNAKSFLYTNSWHDFMTSIWRRHMLQVYFWKPDRAHQVIQEVWHRDIIRSKILCLDHVLLDCIKVATCGTGGGQKTVYHHKVYTVYILQLNPLDTCALLDIWLFVWNDQDKDVFSWNSHESSKDGILPHKGATINTIKMDKKDTI